MFGIVSKGAVYAIERVFLSRLRNEAVSKPSPEFVEGGAGHTVYSCKLASFDTPPFHFGTQDATALIGIIGYLFNP